jgi:hypothetical protein
MCGTERELCLAVVLLSLLVAPVTPSSAGRSSRALHMQSHALRGSIAS